MYENSNEPMIAPQTKRSREPVVRVAVERLEKLAAESDELVERLQSTFSPVLFHVAQSVEASRERDRDAIPGSDLGQALSRLAERIGSNFRAIRNVIESADV